MRLTTTWVAIALSLFVAIAIPAQESESDTALRNFARGYGVLSDDPELLKQVGSMVLFRIMTGEPLSTLPAWVQKLKDTKPSWIDALRDQGWPEGKTYSQREIGNMNMARMYGIRSNNPDLLYTIGWMVFFRTANKIPLSTLPTWVSELAE